MSTWRTFQSCCRLVQVSVNSRLQHSRIFGNASDGKYSNERSGASVKMASENVERRHVRLACYTREDDAYGASRLPQKSENDCFAAYVNS